MPKRKVSDLFVKCLENEGVRYIFGVPGEENEDLLFSLAASSIKFIPTRHEQGAAFMANVWGRLTGQAGVCLSTLGPGATNLMTGVADAYLDKSPLVAITGQSSLEQISRESHQYLDIVNMFRPITKWNASITSAEAVPELVRKAFKVAELEKPGATHLELPENVASLESDEEPVKRVSIRRPSPDAIAIKEALQYLKQARRPLILAGNGAIRKRASRELRALSSEFHIPVMHTFMGQGAISDRSPESLLTIGLGFRDIVMDAVDQADLILAVGYDIVEYTPESWNPGNNKIILHVDFLPAEVYSHYQPKVEVIADISGSLKALHEGLRNEKIQYESEWFAPIRTEILADLKSYDLAPNAPFHVPGVLNLLREAMTDEDLLISDVGAHKMWIARNFPVYCANGCIISNGLASMGIALPGAIAAALESPRRHVVAAVGDGGLLMNIQELETAKRLGVSMTILVFNDNDYGLISWKQRMHRNKDVGTRISNPDFSLLAKSFGMKAYAPKNPAELKASLSECLQSHQLALIDIPVDSSVNDQLDEKLAKRARNKK